MPRSDHFAVPLQDMAVGHLGSIPQPSSILDVLLSHRQPGHGRRRLSMLPVWKSCRHSTQKRFLPKNAPRHEWGKFPSLSVGQVKQSGLLLTLDARWLAHLSWYCSCPAQAPLQTNVSTRIWQILVWCATHPVMTIHHPGTENIFQQLRLTCEIPGKQGAVGPSLHTEPLAQLRRSQVLRRLAHVEA